MKPKSKYEEALGRARQGRPIDEIFPELKESEDERIRKELLKEIEFISPRDGETDGEGLILPSYHARIDRYKSYLERQKEQKHYTYEQSKQAAENCYYDKGYNTEDGGRCNEQSFLWGFEEGVDWCEQQKERKPAEWSEEDEEMLKDIRFNFVFNKDEMTDALIAQYNRFFDKIKSLKPQPKQEWSKEDERNLYNTIEAIKYAYDVSEGSSGSRLIAWLKFHLRPQSHWKPSEEQMKALEDAFRKDGGNEYRKVINSLYCDLQKLL